jgi:5-methylcytosine-specific restriction endonuclease McrA
MYKCKFCGRESSSNSGNSYHQNRCKSNPDRISGYCYNKGLDEGNKHSSFSKEIPENILDVSKRTMIKIFKRLKLHCSHCGWYVEGVSCDAHHIISKNKNGKDTNDNLTYICPNCHRLAHSGKIRPEDLIPLTEQIGDRWKDYLYYKK